MKKKVMKGLPKRIAAFTMAVLMFLSLMPIDPSVVLAGDTYTFSVVEKGTTYSIEEAEIKVYNGEELVARGFTNEAGVLELQEDVEAGNTYEVILDGFKIATGSIIDNDEEILVELEKYIKLLGEIDLPGENSDYHVIKVELLNEEENVAFTAGVDEFGWFVFENVLAGNEYQLKISSLNNEYKTIIDDVNLIGALIDLRLANPYSLEQNETLALEFPDKDETDNDIIREVYKGGTQKTFAPSVKNAEGNDVAYNEGNGYTITYAIQDPGVQGVTVSADSAQNLVVNATADATEGPVEVTVTLTGDDYVTVSKTVTIQIKEKIENGAFNFVADGITNGGSYEVDYNPNGTCAFNATAGIKDVDGNVTNTPGITYAVIEDGEGEDDTILSIDVNTGAIIVNKAGTATITATLPASGDYLQTTVKIKLTVKEIEQEHNLLFDEAQNNELEPNGGGTLTKTFGANNTYNFAVKTEEQSVNIEYSVTYVDEDSITKDALTEGLVAIEGSNVTFNQAGTYTVTATASKANYIDKTVAYTVIIEKADPGLYFSTAEEDVVGYTSTIINGKYLVDEDNFIEAVLKSDVLGNEVNTGVKYSVDSDFVSIDEETGQITFDDIKDASVGSKTVTITATREESESYREASVTYTFNVIDWDPTTEETFEWENIYDITAPNENGWYSQNSVTVTLEDIENYEFFVTAPVYDTEGVSSYEYTGLENKENNEISFYLMDKETKYISAKYTISNINVDTEASSISVKQGENTFLEKLLNFFKGQQEFVVDVTDSVSPNTIYYYVADGATAVEPIGEKIESVVAGNWISYGDKVVVDTNKASVIYAKVVDAAGNTAYANTNGLITDNTAPEIIVTTPELLEEQNGYYKENFDITVLAKDQQGLSGISSIVYWIGEKQGEGTVLKSFDVNASTTATKLNEYISGAGTISIVAGDEKYNTADGITIVIEATDNAGNKTEVVKTYKICIEEPEIVVNYGENDPEFKCEKNGVKYYDANRTATITINSREDVFNSNNVRVNGNIIPKEEWNGQTVEVSFTTNGEHTLEVTYVNEIGDPAEKYLETFLIDKDDPTGTAALHEEDGTKSVWDQLLSTLTFGIWKKATATVSATANADTTDVTMQYYISNSDSIMTKGDLDALTANTWISYTKDEVLELKNEDLYAVYFKLTDSVGRVTYLSTDGFIVDMNGSEIAITPTTDPSADGYYNSNVVMNITAEENISGIKSVEYWVMCGNDKTQGETLYTFSNGIPAYDELIQSYSEEITVDAKLNNSDDVVVYAKVIDNAGYETTTEYSLKINSTAPTVDIRYDNNTVTGKTAVNSFFNAIRKATITITDRADTFDATAATNAIKNGIVLMDKAVTEVTDTGVVISEWTSDGNKHTATVQFVKDGYYTVDVVYTNTADLRNDGVNPEPGTKAALAFVIDREKPFDVTVSTLTKTWDALLETITFGLYTAEDVVFTITGEDEMSSVVYEYYIANDGESKTAQQLAQVADELWTEHTEPATISTEQQMSIFVRVTDQAGNTTYVNSNGIVLDKTAAGITLKPEGENTNNVYSDNVDVEISVDDSAITSGIKSVKYWITCNGTITKEITEIEINDSNSTTKNGLVQLFNDTITVDAETNNSSDVKVTVEVIDNAGNVQTESVELDIDITAPTIEVSYDDVDPVDIVDGKGFFNTNRTATIVVTERTNHFDKAAFANAVAITAKNSANVSLSAAVPVVEYVSTTEGTTADAAKHEFKVVFNADANYTLAINYTDKAGWTCTDAKVKYDKNAVTPQNFAIDTKAPTGKITVGNLGFWESLLSSFTFGLWSPSDVNIVITGSDATSPIKSIEYYKTSEFTPKTVDQLKDVTAWVAADKFTVSSDDIFVVYAKITDQTNHVSYISSNGIIVDETKPVFETYKPEVTITPQRPVNGIYDGNVKVDIGVIDPIVGNNAAYAGLRSVVYKVTNMGTTTQEGTLYNFTEENPTKDKLLQKWNGNIVVDASKNNSNEVVVEVIATDNAGNQTKATTTLKIDTTKPVIEVSYDNNNGDASFADGVYYNANRTATIKVTERNFDPSAVNVVITNTDGTVPTISGWTTTAGTGNGDNTVHTATIVYAADGDYTFAISAKDKVGNANNGVNYGNSQAPTAFTIDKTVPVISIAYDNNAFANENYYKADRTATITILEHNFDASRVVATITATDNGQPVNAPAISNWSKSGDTYTATVNYTTDALYTFDISYSDKAQNEAADFAQQSFYVDKTMPQMSITEIVDQSANNKDKIGFVITATDTNFDVFTPVLTAVVKTETGFTTKELNIASINDIANGRVYTISNIDTDGIYRITCTLVDKAGNAYNSVTLHQADGTPYVAERTAEDTLVAFSVNRNGSVFEVDEATKEVLDNYYVYDVKEDIVIIEVNANQLTSNTVSLNGKELVEGTDYTITTDGGNGAWLRYSYSLNKELFAEEGEYTIVVSSTDEAENNAFSDVKDMKVAFVVDRTAPVVTVSGLETNGRYQTDAQTVTLIPTDDGGAVKSIVVNQVDKDGNVIKALLSELSGEALEAALEENDGQISFVIPSGTYDYIEIVCADCSVNETGSTNTVEILIEDVLITENELALIWATYQYAIIGGGATAVAAPTGIVLFRRRLKLKVK